MILLQEINAVPHEIVDELAENNLVGGSIFKANQILLYLP